MHDDCNEIIVRTGENLDETHYKRTTWLAHTGDGGEGSASVAVLAGIYWGFMMCACACVRVCVYDCVRHCLRLCVRERVRK